MAAGMCIVVKYMFSKACKSFKIITPKATHLLRKEPREKKPSLHVHLQVLIALDLIVGEDEASCMCWKSIPYIRANHKNAAY